MIKIGLIGLGIVNSGVYEIINSRLDYLQSLAKDEIKITKILVNNQFKKRSVSVEQSLLTDNQEEFLNQSFDIVVEAITDLEVAYHLIKSLLLKSCDVVTASKAVVSKYFDELFTIAKDKNCGLYIEASVAGGIPIIKPMIQAMSTNTVTGIKAILNGTTNFILSKMYDEAYSFKGALKLAQDLGYAEADPTDDIEGYDALRKLTILSSIAYKTRFYEADIPCRGITSISSVDMTYFKELQLIPKLIGESKIKNMTVSASVEPTLFEETSVFNTVQLSNNIVSVTGDNVGELQFYGQGAGKLPTANSIVSDIVDILGGIEPIHLSNLNDTITLKDELFLNKYYVRITVGHQSPDSFLDHFKKHNIQVKIINNLVELVLITEDVSPTQIKHVVRNFSETDYTYLKIDSPNFDISFEKRLKPVFVQKYGGSSVDSITKIKKIAKRIIDKKSEGYQVVIVLSAMGDTTSHLINMAKEISHTPSKRELDMLLSTGEQMSVSLLAMAIKELGETCISLTGTQSGIMTDDTHNEARIIKVNTKRINKELNKNKIVIITGFQGTSKNADITTLGRGGSDTTATAIAVALNAEKCEILTDVRGVYSADPTIVKDAKLWSSISYDEMLELSSLGTKVLHPRAVELVKKHRIPLEVKSSLVDKPGTHIMEENMIEKVLVRGITKDNTLVKISILNVPDKPGIAYNLFDQLAKKKISIDIIIQAVGRHNNNDISFTIPKKDLSIALTICKEFIKPIKKSKVVYDENIVKLSIVGIGMSSSYDVASTFFKALYETDINIQMISTSELKISCIIEDKFVDEAIQKTHDYFQLGEKVQK
ncbi:MAG: aspartate kinase [Candidatus Izimaplasma sp.]|nr:aspartate kinase [Candidatus Izimaplasma bacterium]